ncbi:hypothetical protein [Streptomyces azureus]|uniref:hypothetical protein n=1 Tax=Streptomyces azureus TaxID=146537 RepID=UPI00157B02F2|nr:hypothetical protein [Streptomyces azureus]
MAEKLRISPGRTLPAKARGTVPGGLRGAAGGRPVHTERLTGDGIAGRCCSCPPIATEVAQITLAAM